MKMEGNPETPVLQISSRKSVGYSTSRPIFPERKRNQRTIIPEHILGYFEKKCSMISVPL